MSNRPAIIQSVFDFAIREINALEGRIVQADDDVDAMLWEQARQVVAQLEAGSSQRQLAAQWINARTGEPYSQAHVSYIATVVDKHAYQTPRPRFREVYQATAHASTRQQLEDVNRATLSQHAKLAAKALGIHHGDFRKLAPRILPDDSVQLVLTDPPYDEGSVELFEAAAKEAARVLRPGGSFVAYSGQKYLGEVITACSQHLRYWWLFTLIHEGQGQLLQKLGVRCDWKPIIWFVKTTRGDVSAIFSDLVDGAGREKDRHEWQQAETEAAQLIERFTKPGDLVVDFMAGSGTIPAAAKRLERRIVAFELRADNVEKITERLA